MSGNAGPPKPTLNPYQPLPQAIGKNLRVKFSFASPHTPAFVEKHLKKSANLDAKALYESRVKGRTILLENPARTGRLQKEQEEKKARRAKEKERKKLGIIGRKEAGLKGLWNLEEDQKKYELFVPLHHLWLGYMSELLNLNAPPPSISAAPSMPNVASMHMKLVKADFHGSIMAVKQAKNPCLVGLSGIVIHETENAFRVITTKNQLKLIPKQNTIFAFRVPLYDVRASVATGQTEERSGEEPKNVALDLASIPQMEFQLYGNQFRFRAAERAGKKFKAKESIEL